MLVCKNCNIEYEEGKKFCKHCGDPLVPKEEPLTAQKKKNKVEEENPDGKLFCPVCKITYEFGSSCIQCGSPLGRQVPAGARDEAETAPGGGPEEKGPPVQRFQGPQIDAFRGTLICPSCKITYERGDFCIECGSALLSQISSQAKEEPEKSRNSEAEGKPLQVGTVQDRVAKASREKLICPTCGIIYERGDSCVRCGSNLVPQVPSREKEKPKSSDPEAIPSSSPPEISEEISKMDLDQDLTLASKEPSLPSPKEQDLGVSQPVERKKIATTLEELFQDESPEQQPAKKAADHVEKRGSSAKKPKRDYRRLLLEASGMAVMALAGGYLLWSVFSPSTSKPTESKGLPSKETASQILPASSSASNPTATVTESGGLKSGEKSSALSKEASPPSPLSPPDDSKTPSAEIREIRSIKALLEHVRQANLQKDIDLFVSCYASDFRNLDARKRATLAYWEKFNYVDLSYDLKDPSISAETAKARVEWVIKTSSKSGGHPQENKSVLDVVFKKEEGGWRIKEVKLTK
jgi:rRNA maturation endonuclease Nob1/ketosteroid isomerase-like protein